MTDVKLCAIGQCYLLGMDYLVVIKFRDFWSTQTPFSLTPIDRYSLGKFMFKISVGYDFMLGKCGIT